ncbi:MAG: hypothetical protein M9918_19475 [Anaerolineae bacterium]|nr:hypothetical protein [Anaerolineae bacterium]
MKLPANIRQAFESAETLCVIIGTQDGPAFMLKSKESDLKQWRGNRTIVITPALYQSDYGAVLAFGLAIHEKSGSWFSAESYLNLTLRNELELARQQSQISTVSIYIYNQRLRYRFSKRISFGVTDQEQLDSLINQAVAHNLTIPQHDYTRARAEFQQRVPANWMLPPGA